MIIFAVVYFYFQLENRDFYEDAKYFYKEHFARQQQNVIKDLSDLRNEIQE